MEPKIQDVISSGLFLLAKNFVQKDEHIDRLVLVLKEFISEYNKSKNESKFNSLISEFSRVYTEIFKIRVKKNKKGEYYYYNKASFGSVDENIYSFVKSFIDEKHTLDVIEKTLNLKKDTEIEILDIFDIIEDINNDKLSKYSIKLLNKVAEEHTYNIFVKPEFSIVILNSILKKMFILILKTITHPKDASVRNPLNYISDRTLNKIFEDNNLYYKIRLKDEIVLKYLKNMYYIKELNITDESFFGYYRDYGIGIFKNRPFLRFLSLKNSKFNIFNGNWIDFIHNPIDIQDSINEDRNENTSIYTERRRTVHMGSTAPPPQTYNGQTVEEITANLNRLTEELLDVTSDEFQRVEPVPNQGDTEWVEMQAVRASTTTIGAGIGPYETHSTSHSEIIDMGTDF